MIINSYTSNNHNIFTMDEGGTGFTSISQLKTYICNKIYPIGSLFFTTSSYNPSNYFPGTTWELCSSDRVLRNANAFNDNTQGRSDAVLDNQNLVAHTHNFNGSTNSGGEHKHYIYARSVNGGVANQVESFQNGGIWGFWRGGTSWSDGYHTHYCDQTNTESTGESNPSINIMPRGYGVYMWRRTA